MADPGIDAGFLGRVYRTTLILAGVGLLLLLGTRRWDLILSFVAGVAMGLAVVRALDWGLPRLREPPSVWHGLLTGGVLLGKYLPIGLVLYLLRRWELLHVLAAAMGIQLIFSVIVFKVVARVILDSDRSSGEGSDRDLQGRL